jgi:hypothetical protein
MRLLCDMNHVHPAPTLGRIYCKHAVNTTRITTEYPRSHEHDG